MSLTRGVGIEGKLEGSGHRVALPVENGLKVRRMSEKEESDPAAGRLSCVLTLKLDISMDEPDRMHPTEDIGQLAKYTSHKRFRSLFMVVCNEVKELAACRVLEHETRVPRCLKRRRQVNKRGMTDMLETDSVGLVLFILARAMCLPSALPPLELLISASGRSS